MTKPANLITNEHVKRRIVLKKGNIGGDKTILDSVSISFLSKLSKLNLDYSCQVNTNGLQKSTSPTSAVALCWSSWRAQRTVIWFNSAPLKSHPGSIIIRLLVLAPQSGQSKVNPKADLWGTNLTSFMSTKWNPPVSLALFWILMLTDRKDCLPRLLDPFLFMITTSLGGGFSGPKVWTWWTLNAQTRAGFWLNL